MKIVKIKAPNSLEIPTIYITDKNNNTICKIDYDFGLDDCMEAVAKAICKYANIELELYKDNLIIENGKKISS